MPQDSLKPLKYSLQDLWAGRMSKSVRNRFEEMKQDKEYKERGVQNADSTKTEGRVPATEANKGSD